MGDYAVMGNYLGEDILWRCVGFGAVVTEDIENFADGKGGSSTQTVTYTKPFATEGEAKAANDEYYPLMLSDKILCIKPFDACGTDTSGSHGRGDGKNNIKGYYRQNEGSNYWGDSNIRDWINSTALAGSVIWSCGNPPDEDHVSLGYNEYDQEAGFLINFTFDECSAIKKVTQKQLLNGFEYSDNNTVDPNYHQYNSTNSSVLQNYDTAYSETTTDKMFLLDVKQLCNMYANNDTLRDYAVCTASAVSDSEYSSSDISTDSSCRYWLRSPDGAYSELVRYTRSGSSVDCHSPFNGDVGVRPAFYLNPQTVIFESGEGSESTPYTITGDGSVTDDTTRTTTSVTNDTTETTTSTIDDMTETTTAVTDDTTETTTEEANFKIKSVLLESEGELINLLTASKSFTEGSDVSASVNVIIDWGEYSDNKGKVYLIQQGGTSLKSNSGSFGTFKPGEKFTTDGAIYVVVTDSSGNTIGTKAINLTIEPNNVKHVTSTVNLGAFSFTVPEDKPVLGEQTFNFDLGTIKCDTEIDFENSTFKTVIGFNLKQGSDGRFDIAKYKTLKSSVENAKKKAKIGKAVADVNAALKKGGFGGEASKLNNFTIKSGWTPEASVCGYIEGKYEDDMLVPTSGGVILTAALKYSYQGQVFIAIVPICYSIGAGGEVTETFSAGIMEAGDSIMPEFSGDIEIKPYFEVKGGHRCCLSRRCQHQG